MREKFNGDRIKRYGARVNFGIYASFSLKKLSASHGVATASTTFPD